MAIPDGASHVIVSGTSTSAEGWSFGWWEDTTTVHNDADLDSASMWSPFRDELLAAMATDQTITDYDVYRYMGGTINSHAHHAVSHVGTSAGSPLPLQLCTVITLRTALLSRRGRGRMYLPTNGASILAGSDHIWGATRVHNLVDKFATYAQNEDVANRPVVVVSRVNSAMGQLSSVDADLIPDTQRRRRDKLTSTRYSVNV